MFGDGSVVILRTPGHTPGHSSLLVRLPERNFILTGDAVHLRTALEADLPMPSDANTRESVASIRLLRRLRDSLDATMWISHDPEDWGRVQARTGRKLAASAAVTPHVADIRDPERVDRAFAVIEAEGGPAPMLVNAAGGAFLSMEAADAAAAHPPGPGAGPTAPRTIRGRPSRVKDRSAAA